MARRFLRKGAIKPIPRVLSLLATQTGLTEAVRTQGPAPSGTPAWRAQGPCARGPGGSLCPAPGTVADCSRWVGPSRFAFRELGSAPSVPVFNHLFDSIGRPLDDFPRRYAIHYRLVQTPNNSRYKRHVGARVHRQPITSAPYAQILPSASAERPPAPPSQRQVLIGQNECQSRASYVSSCGLCSRPKQRLSIRLEGNALARQSSRSALPIGSFLRAEGIRNLQPIGTEVLWRRLVHPCSGDLAQNPGSACRSSGSSPFAAASELGVILWPPQNVDDAQED